MLSDYSRPHCIRWRLDRPHLQYSKEPPFVASLDRRRPGIGTRGLRMAREVEDVDGAFPYCFAFEHLVHWNALRERRGTAMHLLDGIAEAIDIFAH